jgi:hypothetical protein
VQVVLVGLQGKMVSNSLCSNVSPSALLHRRINESFKPTNTHHDEEPSAKSPKVDDGISRTLHEIIRI